MAKWTSPDLSLMPQSPMPQSPTANFEFTLSPELLVPLASHFCEMGSP
jgi:hypothetical protein